MKDRAILVMDMPDNCRACSLRYNSWGKCEVCILKDCSIDDFYATNTKPDWCPLKPVPEKYGLADTYYEYELGYNRCIDEILKIERQY